MQSFKIKTKLQNQYKNPKIIQKFKIKNPKKVNKKSKKKKSLF